ncbi:hypothetical protein F4824DRAFT_458850, partial [Ustulina deusta]
MPYDTGIFWNNYGAVTYDTPMVPAPGPLAGLGSFDYGLDFTDEFDAIFTPSQASCGAQFALYHQAQHSAEAQDRYLQAVKTTFLLQSPPNSHTCYTELPSSTYIRPERNCSSTSLTSCSDKINQDGGQVEPPIVRPRVVRNSSFIKAESPLSKKSRSETSKSHLSKHNADDVPLYNPGVCDTATVVSQLRSMENGFRAETTRRIAQVAGSQI